MTTCRWVIAVAALWLLPMAATSRADTGQAPAFRVFLKDGSSLASYGEMARVGDRVVFSMPTSASSAAPELQLVNLPADKVDWDKTDRYSESVRASGYLAGQAATDYALLSDRVAQALNDVGHTEDRARRLAIVQQARQALAEWPARHYNYKAGDVQQMLAILDEAIADLGARAGERFNLTLVAAAVPPPTPLEPLLPPLTPEEAIAQTLAAAHLTDSAPERVALLSVGVNALSRDAGLVPPDWAAAASEAARREIAQEQAADRAYRSLSNRMLALASLRARRSDVIGVERVLRAIRSQDAALGGQRPDVVNALVDSVETKLDAARQLQLERDRWRLRLRDFYAYRDAVAGPLARMKAIGPALDSIKALAGSAPEVLGRVLSQSREALGELARITPPDELSEAHAALVSAVSLAGNAARTRREAALTRDIARAWDASSAAAGAALLESRARSDIQAALRRPQLPPSTP